METLNDRKVDWKCSTRLMAGSLLYIVYMEDHYRNLELSIISRETDYYSNEAVIWVNVINQRLSFDVINFILEIQ